MSRSHQFIWALLAALLLPGAALAQDPQQKSIDERFREMQEKYEKRISALELEVRALREESAEHHEHGSEIDRAIAHLPHPPAGGRAVLRATPASREPGRRLARHPDDRRNVDRAGCVDPALQGGGHDPKKRGFTLSSGGARV